MSNENNNSSCDILCIFLAIALVLIIFLASINPERIGGYFVEPCSSGYKVMLHTTGPTNSEVMHGLTLDEAKKYCDEFNKVLYSNPNVK